jgi:hypothetical protein
MIVKFNYFTKILVWSIFLLTLLYLFYQNDSLNFTTKITILSLYSLIVFSSLYELYKLKENTYLPIFILTNIYFFSCYIALFFFDKEIIFPRFYEENFETAIKVFCYGYLAFLIGSSISYNIFKKFNRNGFKSLDATNNEIFIIGFFLLLLNLFFFELFDVNNYISGLAQIKYPLIAAGIGLLVEYLIDCQKDKKLFLKKFISVVLIFITLFLFVLTTALSYPFMFVFLIYVYYCYRKKQIYILPFIIIIFVFLFFHLGKYEFRHAAATNSQKTILYKIKDLINAQNFIIKNKYSLQAGVSCKESWIEDGEEGVDCRIVVIPQLERRIFHSMDSLLIVTMLSPKTVPYWDGYTYDYLKSKIIPRIIWKNKPQDRLGNEFGHRYNILTPENKERREKKDVSTSWNMPVLNELYVNYGNKGVFYGMLIIGLLYSFIAKIFAVSSLKNIENPIAFFVFVPIFFLESHASLVFGAVIQSYIFAMFSSFILLKILRKFN